ncbi:MAG: hypothetical protein PSV35_04335 [bacterium]|nr:hypothetical protein [bacterium]
MTRISYTRAELEALNTTKAPDSSGEIFPEILKNNNHTKTSTLFWHSGCCKPAKKNQEDKDNFGPHAQSLGISI